MNTDVSFGAKYNVRIPWAVPEHRELFQVGIRENLKDVKVKITDNGKLMSIDSNVPRENVFKALMDTLAGTMRNMPFIGKQIDIGLPRTSVAVDKLVHQCVNPPKTKGDELIDLVTNKYKVNIPWNKQEDRELFQVGIRENLKDPNAKIIDDKAFLSIETEAERKNVFKALMDTVASMKNTPFVGQQLDIGQARTEKAIDKIVHQHNNPPIIKEAEILDITV